MAGKTNCENCSNYIFDEEYGYYICDMDLDEDDQIRFLSNSFHDCPYFQYENEYKIVKKQM